MGRVSVKRGVQPNLISGYFFLCSVRHRSSLVLTIPPLTVNPGSNADILDMCTSLFVCQKSETEDHNNLEISQEYHSERKKRLKPGVSQMEILSLGMLVGETRA